MPQKTLDLGAYARVYIGDTYATPGPGPGSYSTAALTLLTSERTKGGVFKYFIPLLWVPALNGSLPGAQAQISFDFTFYGASDPIMKVAQGNSLTASRRDSPSVLNHFTVLLVHQDPTITQTILVPECEVELDLQENREKLNPVEVPIKFKFFKRDRFATPQPYYQDTLAWLNANVATFGARCPST